MTSIRSPQQLWRALRAARKQLGLTQPQLALAAGVGVRFIVDLEAGKPTLRFAMSVTVRAASVDWADHAGASSSKVRRACRRVFMDHFS